MTNSTISLSRIRNVLCEYKPFIENRLNYTRSRSEIESSFYIPTDLNPADLPSRGCLPHELVGNELYIHGPECIREHDFDYKKFENDLHSSPAEDTDDPELKSTSSENVLLANVDVKPNLRELIDITKFNDLAKLLRVTAYVIRFTTKNRETDEITAAELKNARNLWIAHEQEYESRTKKDEFMKTKANLRIYTDEKGIMRCKGRLSNSELPYDTKYPIYIPKGSHLAKLIVIESHENVFHQKERATLTEVRSNNWIPQCRRLVRNLVPKCQLCLKFESLDLSLPPAPSLPSYRVEISPPFTNVGFDHMGPLWVYDLFNRDETHKVYVALYTCCSTRMLHLELQPALDAPACIRSFKRTFARVGRPKLLISDNHKTFRSRQLSQFANHNSISWKYILELAPHWGGFYERLNRSVKSALRKTLWKSTLDYEEVETRLKISLKSRLKVAGSDRKEFKCD